MKPTSIELQNYRSFEKVSMILSDCTAVSVVGQNGAGKSTLIEAITWALYGDSRSAGVDGPVRLGESECSVTFEFEHDYNTYRIIRKRVRDRKSELHLLRKKPDIDWDALTCASMRETQEVINNLLGMDRLLWGASAYIMQGESAGICESTPAERKKTLSTILQDKLARFAKLHIRAKEEISLIDNRLVALDTTINVASQETRETANIATELTETRDKLELLEAEHIELSSQRDAIMLKINTAEERNRAGQKLQTDFRELQNMYSKLLADISGLESDIIKADELLGNAEIIRDDVKRLEDAERQIQIERANLSEHHRIDKEHTECVNDLERSIATKQHDKATMQGKLDLLTSKQESYDTWQALIDGVPCMSNADMVGSCAVRNQALKAVRVNYILDIGTMEADIYAVGKDIDTLKLDIATENKNFVSLKSSMPDYETSKTVESNLAKIIVGASSARAKLAALVDGEHAVARLNDRMEDARKSRRSMEDQLAIMDNDCKEIVIIDVMALRNENGIINGRISSNRTVANVYNNKIGILTEKQDKAKLAADAIEIAEGQKNTLASSREILVALQQAFGRDGIPALVIDAVVPEIETVANENLSVLSNGAMNLHFITQRVKADNGIAETLDIIISDESGERPYEDWSGGERLRIDLAVRWALMKLLANRNGQECKVMFLDEVCAPLDDAGEDALIECINTISQHITVFLITHRDSLKGRLPQQISVTKRDGESASTAVLM